MKKDTSNRALIFAGITVSPEESFRVGLEIKKIGGLTFSKIKRSKEGWFTQCDQVPGIIAGNTNPNPDNVEIEAHIRQAIIAAFNIKVVGETSIESPFRFEYDSVSHKE